MWILMTSTYQGDLGCFPKGHKMDLPPDVVAAIPRGSYKKCPAPWDEHKDGDAIERADLEARIQTAKQRYEKLVAEADQAQQKVNGLRDRAAAKERESGEANRTFNKALKAASNELTPKVRTLRRQADRIALELEEIEGELVRAKATAALERMDAEDVSTEGDKLIRQLNAMKAKAKAKAKAEAPVEPEDGEPKEDRSPESKDRQQPQGDNPVAEGQAVSP